MRSTVTEPCVSFARRKSAATTMTSWNLILAGRHFFGAYGTIAFQTWKEVEVWLKETEDLYGAEK